MRGDTPAGGGLMVCLLWWLLSLHMILECQPSYFKHEYVWWMEGYVLQALMQHPWRAKVEVWKQQSSRWLVSIPSLLNFGGASALCLSCHCCSPVTAVLWRLLVPELTFIGVWRLLFLLLFFSPCINLVSFNLIASFSDRLSQEQCKWALKCGDLVYICRLIAWVAQTSRAGTCLLALRSAFDFRPDATCRRRFPDGEWGCDALLGQWSALDDSDLNSSGWVPYTLTASTETVTWCKAIWIHSSLGDLAQPFPREAPAFTSVCLCPCCMATFIHSECTCSRLPEM